MGLHEDLTTSAGLSRTVAKLVGGADCVVILALALMSAVVKLLLVLVVVAVAAVDSSRLG